MPEYSAGKVNEYANGDRRVVVCGEFEVGVFRVGDEFYAWHNRCAHRAGPICQGKIMNRVLEPVDSEGCTRALAFDDNEPHIICPWHGYEYSIKTGAFPGNSSVKLRRAELRIEKGEIYVCL